MTFPPQTPPTARFNTPPLLLAVAMIGSFIGMVLWFDQVDFYHLHFFDNGAIVLADNALRVVFTAIFSWMTYALGAAIVALLMGPSERSELTPAERAILGFGIGVGVWHIAMMILGVLGLYYRMVMVGLCLAILVASAPHFAEVAIKGWRALSGRSGEPRRRGISRQTIGAVLIGIAAIWLLLLRGLYPGGGGDYYTHYFYYYLAVLKNHGIAPNDVWYHYYYSKGSGLAFLGMLLTDPEAPALTTFACVMFAALAIVTLIERLAPRTLWPAAAALVYLSYYLISLIQNGENAFQKDHEEVTALVVLMVWALCMERRGPSLPFLVLAAASATAAAIVTQSVGVVLGLYAGLLCAWYAVRGQWTYMLRYFCLGAGITVAVLSMFALSYWQTGMATDQPLDLALNFANFEKLDRWGVIPQLVATAWIRDNYLAPPLDAKAVFKQLEDFMRLGFLWPYLTGMAVAAIALGKTGAFAGGRLKTPRDPQAAAFALTVCVQLAVLIGLLIVIALAMGPAQSNSFSRLSTFFVPLIVLCTTTGIAWVLNWPLKRHDEILMRLALPMLLVLAVFVSWQQKSHWWKSNMSTTANAMRFFTGNLSLAQAYELSGDHYYSFGAINPGDLAAARQVPDNTPIWSISVNPYCMVPGCFIEGVISFKMSGRLDEILGGEPELAKQRLQEAGLNYFVFIKGFWLLDVLPYSRLFAPETIGKYLGVKWTDGSSFLLTWIGPETTPIGADFLDPYREQRDAPDPTGGWFKFDQMAQQIVAISPRLRSVTQWGTATKLFTWRQPSCPDC